MLVAGAKNKTVDEMVRSIKVYSESLAERSCDLVATIVNRVDPALLEEMEQRLVSEKIRQKTARLCHSK